MTLLRRAGLAFIFLSLGKIISYILQITLARMNTAYVYGQYAYAISLVTTIAVFSSIGFNNSIIRFVPEYLRLRKYKDLHGFLITARKATLIGGGILGVISFLILLVLPHGFNWKSAALFGSTVPLIAIMQYYSELTRSLGYVSRSVVPNTILQPSLILIIISSVYVVTGSSNLTSIAFCLATSYILVLLFYRRSLSHIGTLWNTYTPKFSVKSWRNISVTMIFMVGFQTIVSQADIIVVGSVMDPTNAGFYNVGTKVAAFANFVLAAVNQVFAPRIASLNVSGDRVGMQRELTRAAVITFLPTLVIATTLYIASIPILSVFGSEFIHAKTVLRILVFGQTINAAAGPVGYILNLTDHHRVSTRIYGITALVNIVGCYLAARLTGSIDTVALASMGSMVLWNVWMHISVVHRLGVWPSIMSLFKPSHQSKDA